MLLIFIHENFTNNLLQITVYILAPNVQPYTCDAGWQDGSQKEFVRPLRPWDENRSYLNSGLDVATAKEAVDSATVERRCFSLLTNGK